MLVGEAGGHLPFGFETTPLEAWLTTVAWGSRDDLRDVVRLARRGRLRWNVERVPLRDAAHSFASGHTVHAGRERAQSVAPRSIIACV